MAVPKKKMSKSRTRRRKATHKVSKPHFVVDPETGLLTDQGVIELELSSSSISKSLFCF